MHHLKLLATEFLELQVLENEINTRKKIVLKATAEAFKKDPWEVLKKVLPNMTEEQKEELEVELGIALTEYKVTKE